MAQFYNGVFYKNDIDAKIAKLQNEGGNATEFFNGVGDVANVIGSELGTGLKNLWFSVTGQGHRTDAYQYEQYLEDTAMQRAAKDMEAAGLSKYGGVSAAGVPSANSKSSVLETMLGLSQLKAQKLANQESSWNLNKAKEWGVPTSAVSDFAKYDAVCQLLFGKPLHDLVGSDGVIGKLKDWFGIGSGSSDPDEPVLDSVAAAATTDVVPEIDKEWSPLMPVFSHPFSTSNVMKPVPFVFKLDQIPSFNDWKKDVTSGKVPDSASPTALATKVLGKTSGKDLAYDVDKFCKKMLNDDKLDDYNIDRLAYSLGKRYGIGSVKVRMVFDAWLQENAGTVIYRFEGR